MFCITVLMTIRPSWDTSVMSVAIATKYHGLSFFQSLGGWRSRSGVSSAISCAGLQGTLVHTSAFADNL